MKCTHCGADTIAGDQFCGDCGHRVLATVVAPPVAQPLVSPPAPVQKSRAEELGEKTGRWLTTAEQVIGLIIGIILLLAALGGLISSILDWRARR